MDRIDSMFTNYMQRYVKTTFFKGHSVAVRCISPNFNETFPISAAKDDVKIWTRQRQTDLQGAFIYEW